MAQWMVRGPRTNKCVRLRLRSAQVHGSDAKAQKQKEIGQGPWLRNAHAIQCADAIAQDCGRIFYKAPRSDMCAVCQRVKRRESLTAYARQGGRDG